MGVGLDRTEHKGCDEFYSAQIRASGDEQLWFENDIFVLHIVCAILLDGMELSRADDNDVSGCDGQRRKVRGHKAAPLLYDDELHFGVPVQRNRREVAGNGAEISIVWKIRRGMGFCLVIVLVFADIHNGLLSVGLFFVHSICFAPI